MKTKNNKVINTDILLQAETKDALLHAINEEYVEAVEVLLDHEESIHLEGEPWSWETLSEEEAVFSTDMTPLVLAAHTNNYEIIKILLDRGASLPCPHHHRCGCEDCSGIFRPRGNTQFSFIQSLIVGDRQLALFVLFLSSWSKLSPQSPGARTVSVTLVGGLTLTAPWPRPPSSLSRAKILSSLPSNFHGN